MSSVSIGCCQKGPERLSDSYRIPNLAASAHQEPRHHNPHAQLKKDSLDLQVGDQIIWQDVEIKSEEGFVIVSPGMRGKVISLHDGFQMDLSQEGSVPPKALVRFENGISLLVDPKMKWEKVAKR